MLKLLELLELIYLDKLMFKSSEYRLGFTKAIDIVKIHGFKTEMIHETKELRKEVEQLLKDKEFLTKRLQLEKEKVQSFTLLNNKLNSIIQDAMINGNRKSIKRINQIKRVLINKGKTSDEKVTEVLAYIKSIKETKALEDESNGK